MSDKIGVEHFFARLSDMLLLFTYFPVTRHGKHIAMLVFIAHFAIQNLANPNFNNGITSTKAHL